MFGYNRLKRRYRRFRYNNLARYPRLFVVLGMVKLPFQIALIALPLWFVVGLYDKHFSYQAKNRALTQIQQTESARQATTNEEAVSLADTVAIERRAASTVATVVDEPAANPSSAESVEPSIQTASKLPSATMPVAVSVNPLQDLVVEPRQTNNTKAAEVADAIDRMSGPSLLPEKPMGRTADAKVGEIQIRDGNWLALQDSGSYVIQLESSSNYDAMQVTVQKLNGTGEVAIYPYKLAADGGKVFGLSYGLFSSLEEAKAENEKIPPELRQFGTWIRKVGVLKSQIIR